MERHKEALYHSLMAQEIADCAKPRLPEAEHHSRRVWELAGQLLFPALRQARGLRLILGGASAVALCYTGYLCIFGIGKAEANLINFVYTGMRQSVKVAPYSQTMPRILVQDGRAYKVTYQRKAGDPFVVLHVVGQLEPIDPSHFDKAVEEVAIIATDG